MPNFPAPEALQLCQELVALAHSNSVPLSAVIARAHRLAVLIDDPLGEYWLSLEQRDFRFEGPPQPELGARLQSRLGSREAAASFALEMAEAWQKERTVTDYRLDGDHLVRAGVNGRGESVAGIESLISAIEQVGSGIQAAHLLNAENRAVLDRIRLRVLEYLARTEARLRARLAAASAIEGSARQIEVVITAKAPQVLDHLRAADDALRSSSVDGPAHALLSLRRALLSLADSVYPARGVVACADGVTRDLSADKYKNRIVEFVSVASRSKSGKATAVAEIEHVASRLDALYVQQNKGVHDEVLAADAERVIARTYFIVGDVLDLVDG